MLAVYTTGLYIDPSCVGSLCDGAIYRFVVLAVYTTGLYIDPSCVGSLCDGAIYRFVVLAVYTMGLYIDPSCVGSLCDGAIYTCTVHVDLLCTGSLLNGAIYNSASLTAGIYNFCSISLQLALTHKPLYNYYVRIIKPSNHCCYYTVLDIPILSESTTTSTYLSSSIVIYH